MITPPNVKALRERPLPDLAGARARLATPRDDLRPGGPLETSLVDVASAGLQISRSTLLHGAAKPTRPPTESSLRLQAPLVERLAAADQGLRQANLRLLISGIPATGAPWRRTSAADQALGGLNIGEPATWTLLPGSTPEGEFEAAAASVILCAGDSGEPLYFGSIVGDVGGPASTDHYEHDDADPALSKLEARANRRLLYWSLRDVGLVNDPDHWWHYSLGDWVWRELNPAQPHTAAAHPRHRSMQSLI